MSQSQSSLRFSLEESICFKKGQEVEELLSISLDPDITIQEQEQYIQIIGSLQLSGEYKGNIEDEQEQELDLHGKFAHHVEFRSEDKTFYFQHHFPVDVTIPKNRINNLEEIDVIIDSFDYVIPEKNSLKLNADLSIFGIQNEEVTVVNEEQEEIPISISPREPFIVEEESDPKEEELVRDDDVKLEKVESESSPVSFEKAESTETESTVESFQDYQFSRLPLIDQETESKESSQEDELFQSFTVEARKKPEDQEEFPINIDTKQEEPKLNLGVIDAEESTDELQPLARHVDESSSEEHEVESSVDITEEEAKGETDESAKKKKKKIGKYESISLADFFARKADEKAAKLKVCIVQHGESLDYLAEKYDISVQQILRMNHLEINQDVYEGQVLYIPSYATNVKSK